MMRLPVAALLFAIVTSGPLVRAIALRLLLAARPSASLKDAAEALAVASGRQLALGAPAELDVTQHAERRNQSPEEDWSSAAREVPWPPDGRYGVVL